MFIIIIIIIIIIITIIIIIIMLMLSNLLKVATLKEGTSSANNIWLFDN